MSSAAVVIGALRVNSLQDPILERLYCPDKQAGSSKAVPFMKMVKRHGGVHLNTVSN